jgi:branched-chain amino acid transport system ATP-binding protein
MSDELKRDPEDATKPSATRAAAAHVAEPNAVEADEAVLEGREQVVAAEEAAPSGEGARRAAAALAGVQPEPGVAKPDPVLIADDVTKSFGGVRAVRVEHLEVQRGTITALIGPNGAGKSTFFNLVSGFDKPDSGRWSFNGKDISGAPAFRIARLGMVRTFQLTKALGRLTTLENVMLGATGQQGERILASPLRWMWKRQESDVTERADALLERFRLDHMRDEFAGIMSGGQRKLLEMARAMMVAPEMIMLDEPMAGVNPALTQSLLGHIERLRDEGTTIVLVEHDMDVIMSISDWIVVFAEGAVIAEGRPDDIRSNAKVIEAYLGKRRSLPERDGPPEASTATTPTTPEERP